MSDPDAPEDTDLVPFEPVAIRTRHDGWTVERQRLFLTALAETGSITLAAAHAGVSTRSAYRLRARPDAEAFADAWHVALVQATERLMTLAYERATRGSVRETWKKGELVSEVRAPSDRLLMFLLDRHLPTGRTDHQRHYTATYTINSAKTLPRLLDALVDHGAERDAATDPPVGRAPAT